MGRKRRLKKMSKDNNTKINSTTIQISKTTRDKLKDLKKYPRETYETVLKRLIKKEHKKEKKEIN